MTKSQYHLSSNLINPDPERDNPPPYMATTRLQEHSTSEGPFFIEVPRERHDERMPPAYSDLFKGDDVRGGVN